MVWTTIWSHAQRGIANYSEGNGTVDLSFKQILPVEQIRLVFANEYGHQRQSIEALTVQSNELIEQIGAFSVDPGKYHYTPAILIDSEAAKWKIKFEARPMESGYAFNDADFLPIKGHTDFCTGLLAIEADIEGECLIALGDSLTEGATWTAPLQRKLRSNNLFLVNQGINGSFLLKDSSDDQSTDKNQLFYGHDSFTRLKRCLESHHNVKKVIIFFGANDLIHGELDLKHFQLAVQRLIDYCVERGVDYQLCTLTPCLGYPGMDTTKETVRQTINQWLRENNEQKLWDFAAIVEGNGRLISNYDSGDHLHFNAIGGLMIARQIISDFFKGE